VAQSASSRQCSGMSAIEGKADGSADAAGTAAKIGTPAGRQNCLNVSQKRDTDRRAHWARGKTKYAHYRNFGRNLVAKKPRRQLTIDFCDRGWMTVGTEDGPDRQYIGGMG
jgi:hypothetical protein